MKTSALGLFFVAGTALLTGCQSMTPPHAQPAVTTAATKASAAETVSGDYQLTTTLDNVPAASATGSAWVRVRADNAEQIHIQVRARHTPQQSCYFDAKATLLGQDDAHGILFETSANNTRTFLQFKEGKLMIDGQDRYALAHLCTGGATLAGNYQKSTTAQPSNSLS
ncbi:hypothetical protein [Psychrobacter aestuarii]|uniref:Lipoprotein n=1 Tax=Psychrobacter aestuarii TaxID=556327 RepID=A0ABN0VQ64_9GAMM|nr:hypothetical protein [Psychrobacter aestuarii]